MVATIGLVAFLIGVTPTPRHHVLAVGVADVNTGQPLVGAQVRIPQLGLLRRTGAMGRAVLPGIPADRVGVEARMIGYAPIDVDVLVRDADDTIEVVLLMQPRAIALDTIRATGARLATPAAREIAVRERMGIGRFLDDTAIRREGTRDLATMLSARLPSLRTYVEADGRLALESPRPTGALIPSPCKPTLFLDGWEWREPDFSFVNTADVATVEWYTGETAPVQYRRPGHGCGTLLIWTTFAVDPTVDETTRP